MTQTKSMVFGLVLVLAAGASGAQTNYTATIDGAQQVPPNASAAAGTATLALNAAGDTLTYSITLMGLDLDGAQTADPNDDVTNMHFHNAPTGSGGGVDLSIPGPWSSPYTRSATLSVSQETNLLAITKDVEVV